MSRARHDVTGKPHSLAEEARPGDAACPPVRGEAGWEGGAACAAAGVEGSAPRPPHPDTLEGELEACRRRLAESEHARALLVAQLSALETSARRTEVLEGLVRERNGELVRVRDEAAAASRAKSAFLADMGHELRTPLNAVLGYAEMLLEEAEDLGQDDLSPDLHKLLDAGRQLSTLIGILLDLAKIESGRMDLELETFEPDALVAEVAQNVGPLLAKHGNSLVVRCSPDVGPMRLDVTKLRHALSNLLGNAARFTRHGTVTVEVTLCPSPPPASTPSGRSSPEPEHSDSSARDGARVRFRVSDTGAGMSGEELARVFDPYRPVEGARVRSDGGTGLGLALSRMFCQLMHGDLAAESEVGKGSTFTLEVPRTLAREPDPLTQTMELPSTQGTLGAPLVGPGATS